LIGEATTQWTDYTHALKSTHIRILESEDELNMETCTSGNLYPKAWLYPAKCGLTFKRASLVVERDLEGSMSMLKERIFMWCLIANKVPTWDKMKNM
jgi:hypothetical protein